MIYASFAFLCALVSLETSLAIQYWGMPLPVNGRNAEASLQSGNITGRVTFSVSRRRQQGIRVRVSMAGLTPGQHGFHIHEKPVTTDCDSTGPHYNPKNVSHGAWNAQIRHVGDMMPLSVREDGTTSFSYIDPVLQLDGDTSIVGRAVVIHAKADDLGLGGDVNSTKTGNAGARLVCANITTVASMYRSVDRSQGNSNLIVNNTASPVNVTGAAPCAMKKI
jgi:Cu-Zn family superoxide dismutase